MLYSYIEAFLLGVGLSMDALAVSLALGAAERKNFTLDKILLMAFFFGFFQAVMPLIGWFSGNLLGSIIQVYGKYIAAGLLIFLGGKMIREAFQEENEEGSIKKFQFGRLVLLSFATSIDALLVGISYACLNRTHIWLDFLIIGVTTFLITGLGGFSGRLFGNMFGSKCEIPGGLVLIGIGIKVLF